MRQFLAGIGKFTKVSVLAAAILLAVPASAVANAGTPLLWVSIFHLTIGNALIGIAEGFVLGRLLRIPLANAMSVMIAANYFSAWVGSILIRSCVFYSAQIDLNSGWVWFWVLAFAAYCLTIVFEWPFIGWLLRGRDDWLRRSIRSSLLIQTISCSLLFACYWTAGDASLYTRTKVVPSAEMSLPESVIVYYISADSGVVYRRPINGGAAEAVAELTAHHPNDRLFVRQSTPDSTTWDLIARLETSNHGEPKIVQVLPNLEVDAALDFRAERNPPSKEGSWFNFGKAARLGAAKDSDWEFSAGFWAAEGLKASNSGTGQRIRFALETPFMDWHVRNAVHLPGDVVLFQLGRDQICVLNPEAKTVALLWRGKGPVAVIPRSGPGSRSLLKSKRDGAPSQR